eukprot:Em0010g750a
MALRDCISVLFVFQRRQPQDQQFSEDCMQWLDILLSILLRVATLSDHQFIFNHLLRVPPRGWTLGGQRWTPTQERSKRSMPGSGGVGQGLHQDWGGPLLDHFVNMLANLLLPVNSRFGDMYQHILQIKNGEFYAERCSSYAMLRLIAFCTCLIRLLGAAFSTMKLLRYKEFVKRVGRTIRQTVAYVGDHWLGYKSHHILCGDSMDCTPQGPGEDYYRYSLSRLQLEFDQFVLRATQWILTAHNSWLTFPMPACLFEPSGGCSGVCTALLRMGSSPALLPGAEGQPATQQRTLSTVEQIVETLKSSLLKDQFLDLLMTAYTSEAIFLLTTFANMARAPPKCIRGGELFINTIAVDLFQYASSFISGLTQEQSEFLSWAWEVALMLKLHPNQLSHCTTSLLNPTSSSSPLKHSETLKPLQSIGDDTLGSDGWSLPPLTATEELADLRDAVKYGGHLAFYIALCTTSIGSDSDEFISSGLKMLNALIEEGYYLPVLRIIANITPRFFRLKKPLLADPLFLQVVMALASADVASVSLRERLTFSLPQPLVSRKMGALIVTQLQRACGPGGAGGDTVLQFWLDTFLSFPNWWKLCPASLGLPSAPCGPRSSTRWRRACGRALLLALKNDAKITIDAALKRVLTDLKVSLFPITHLSIYRWAEFCAAVDMKEPVALLGMAEVLHPLLAETSSSWKTSLTAMEQQNEDKPGAREPISTNWLPQTLRLWLDEPRLHDSALYVPGLPQSYDPSRLDTLIQADRPRTVFLVIPASKGQSSHTSYYVAYHHKLFHTCSENVTTVVHFTPAVTLVELMPYDEIKGQLNALVQEWVQVATYQKSLPFKPESSGSQIDSGESLAPPTLMYRVSAVSFIAKCDLLTSLDGEYITAVPELYSNPPRQFQVQVACRQAQNRAYLCTGPANLFIRCR